MSVIPKIEIDSVSIFCLIVCHTISMDRYTYYLYGSFLKKHVTFFDRQIKIVQNFIFLKLFYHKVTLKRKKSQCMATTWSELDIFDALLNIHSRLSRCCAARGSSVQVLLGGPSKGGLVSSVLFTIVPILYKIKNTWLILLSHFILHHFASMLSAVAK